MKFVSKRKRFRLVVKPASHVIDAYGQRVSIPGLTIEFSNGRYETEDPEIISLMLKSPFLGSQFIVANTEQEVQDWIATHPEYAPEVVPMITGGISTVNVSSSAHAVAATQGALRDAARETAIDLESIIEKKIEAKLSPLIGKLDSVLEQVTATQTRPKKVFTCPVPGCGKVFRSGVEVGEHKRLEHAEYFDSKDSSIDDIDDI